MADYIQLKDGSADVFPISKEIIIKTANLGSSPGTYTIIKDTSLYGNYLLLGYSVNYGGANWIWYTQEIQNIALRSSGIDVKHSSTALNNAQIKIFLVKA